VIYAVIAYDGSAPGTFERRMDIRPQHMAVGQKMMDDGSFLFGGAMIDGSGKMCGGVLIVDFEDRSDVYEWLRSEPYVVNEVWDRVEVHQFMVPPQFLGLLPKFSEAVAAS
jgi:uncharacterized protein YciI